jgi:glycerol-3-phosphate dehydrogenase (NAD(P)+)
MTLTEVIKDVIPWVETAVLSGPSHAEEVGRDIPTAIVVGSKKHSTATMIQDTFMNEYFRIYTSPDVIGIELGGSLKNVIALAAGIVDGLGLGDNTKAALMTRGLTEISRLGVAMGGKLETFLGLSGMGDLIVTCTSTHSRNHNAGYLIGQGYTMQQAMDEVKQVVEGVYSAKSALQLAHKYGVAMPIVEQVNHVLFEGKTAMEALDDLFTRARAEEINWDDEV